MVMYKNKSEKMQFSKQTFLTDLEINILCVKMQRMFKTPKLAKIQDRL